MRTHTLISLLVSVILVHEALAAESHGGRVVWWRGPFASDVGKGGTNGVVEYDGEVLSNIVAIAANGGGALLLREGGEVFGWRTSLNEPCAPLAIDGQPLTNVVALSAYDGGTLAFQRDGTVVECDPSLRTAVVLPGLTNVTAATKASNNRLVALRRDGTVVYRVWLPGWEGFAKQLDSFPVKVVSVGGYPVTNVVALTDAPGLLGDCLALKRDGTLLALRFEATDSVMAFAGMTSDPISASLVSLDGEILTNIVAVTHYGGHCRALKSDGTPVAWWELNRSSEPLPANLRNLAALAGNGEMALGRDGTIVTWGGCTNVPEGLSNVIAIAAGLNFSLAITTNAVLPSSVFIPAQGRLEEMEREADLIFKGCVISTEAHTNALFPYWSKTHATRFSLISVLKGKVATNELVFWHITHEPDGWGGAAPPSWHEFEKGQCYLVFAARLDKPEYLYTVPADATNRLDEFRQLYQDGVIRTVDSRAVSLPGVKDVHWLELNLLLNDANPTNQLYAVGLLDRMSLRGGEGDRGWTRSADFKRGAVLNAVQPLINSSNELVAASAIGCFHVYGSCVMLFPDYSGWMPVSQGCPQVEPKSIAKVEPYADDLVAVANSSSSSLCRVAAIAALSCTRFSAVSNSLPRLLADPAAQVRAQAVLLLPDFPGEFCERSLREKAADTSPLVRAAVADAIGNGKIEALLPTLGTLLSTSPIETNSGLWPHKGLQGDGYFAEVGADDIHSSAGYALLKFDVEQVGAILKTNLSDSGFGLSFIRRLAQNGVEPYLPLLAKELKTHTAGSEQEAAKNGFHWPLSYWLGGDYGWAWETLFGYVSARTHEDLAEPKMAPMLDALQIADDPGDARTRSLYGFFLDKGMNERAIELRRGIIRRIEDKAIDKKSFNFPSLLKAFDEMDEKHSLKPGLGL